MRRTRDLCKLNGERGKQKFAGVVKAGGGGAGAPVQRRVDGRSEPRRRQEEDVWVERRHTSARRSEACRQCGVWASDFISGDQERWRTKLELRRRESFDNDHRSAALRTTPQRVRCRSNATDSFFGGVAWRAAK